MANSFFYTDADGNKKGPLTSEHLQTLATKGIITPDTLLESEAGHTGKAGQIRGLKFNTVEPPSVADNSDAKKPFKVTGTIEKLTTSFKNLTTAAPPSTGGFGETPPNAVAAIKKLNFHFRIMQGCLATGLVLLGFFVLLRGAPIGGDAIYYFANFLLLVAGFAGIVGFVFGLILLYQLWKVIPEDIARTTPPNAVGYMLVPLFFLYWMFVAVVGLSEDMNKTFRHRGLHYRVNEVFGMVFCVLLTNLIALFSIEFGIMGETGGSFVFFIAIVLTIACFSVLLAFFKSVKNGAIALLEQGEA